MERESDRSFVWDWAWSGWYWLPVFAYCGLIFYLSSQSFTQETLPSVFKIVGDKVLHMLEYGVLGILCYRGFRYASGSWTAKHAVYLAIAMAALYGASDELHQSFVPLREADHWDLLADCIGAAICTTAWHWLQPLWDISRNEVRV